MLVIAGDLGMNGAGILNISAVQVQRNLNSAALRIVERYNAVTVLKGHGSVIATAGGQPPHVKPSQPIMAGAGYGDVLSN